LNVEGDRNPASWKDGVVTRTRASNRPSASSAKAAGKACSTGRVRRQDYRSDRRRCIENDQTARNLSSRCGPMLTDGRSRAFANAGAPECSSSLDREDDLGAWTGRMNWTEPHKQGATRAGSHARPSRSPEAGHKLFGTKIHTMARTTWHEHRAPRACARRGRARKGEGISVHVPKFLSGRIAGKRNDAHASHENTNSASRRADRGVEVR